MNVLTQNSFWYAAAGLVSALLAVILTHVTLESKRKPVFGWLCWGAALVCYFLFAWIGCTVTTPQWWDYFIFFGWMIFLPPPCFLLYKEPASTKLFTVVTVIFISNVGSFLTGISTTALISTIDPYGEEGYLFLIPFTLMKALIAVIIGVVMVVFVRRTMIEVFNILSHKMGRYVPIPFIASFGFFCIVQIVQAVGLLPQTGMLFVLFYLIICLIFGVMYWLIFSNALWSSRAMKTQAELNVARNIQHDMLPCIFPAFPERNEFDIYATMDPAKEVGGDFYDFFLVDDHHLAIVISDVSGKGVPAALFMVIAKTLIKNQTQPGVPLGEVFTRVNDQLCENNGEGMFVTSFMGVLDLNTRELTFVNAGHNPPLLCRKGGGFEFLKTKPGFVLAGLENMVYKEDSIQLGAGDRIFLYTDGVTEAINSSTELYGDDRLVAALNQDVNLSPEQLLAAVKTSMDAFTAGAEQFDDITMLALEVH